MKLKFLLLFMSIVKVKIYEKLDHYIKYQENNSIYKQWSGILIRI